MTVISSQGQKFKGLGLETIFTAKIKYKDRSGRILPNACRMYRYVHLCYTRWLRFAFWWFCARTRQNIDINYSVEIHCVFFCSAVCRP